MADLISPFFLLNQQELDQKPGKITNYNKLQSTNENKYLNSN